MEHHPTQDVAVEALPGSREGVTIIKLSGPLTMHNFFEFQSLTRKQPAPPVLLIDLTDVPYIDSAVLGSFVGVHVSCDKTGRKYALVNPNERLKKLFAMSNLGDLFVIYSNIAEAERALS
ncbi:MAG: STAS domain-containing protein [Acidobacteriaceae bacterium]|nr:STAS domain-containing protein [Acidobacteriaceae bacterium]MBV9779534.1 STAS domain-containing protein [Acidobacteriaceae bacterium]